MKINEKIDEEKQPKIKKLKNSPTLKTEKQPKNKKWKNSPN